jgi:hypothetical protein
MKASTLVGIGLAGLAVHCILRELRKKEPDIHYVDSIPGNFNGITIPPIGIFINKDAMGNEQLLKHELIHWRQYQRMGLGRYYYDYARDYLKVGYDAHPMELEARAEESAYCRENYTECVRNGTAKTAYNPKFRKAA